MYGHHLQQSTVWIERVRLPILLVVSLDRDDEYFPVPVSRLRIWSRETGSAVRSRVSLLPLHTQAESSITNHQSSIRYLLTGFPPLSAAASDFIPSTAIELIPSLTGHAIVAYRWRSLPRILRHRASSSQAVPSTGAAFSGVTMRPFSVRLSSSTPTTGTEWTLAIQKSIGYY